VSAIWTSGRVPSTHGLDTAPVVGDRSRVVGGGISVMVAGAHKDVVWDAGAGRDPRREALDIEAAIADALARNTRLRHHRIVVTAGPDGLVTLTGTVSTQSLRQEVELACWTVSGVRSLHDDLIVGR
jgi:osmotically-inducible protein OsmY